MRWHTRRNQISSFGETDESIKIGRDGVSSVDYWYNRGVRISGSNAGYTMFRGSGKSTDYPLHSPISPLFPLPCVTVCHHISTELFNDWASEWTIRCSITDSSKDISILQSAQKSYGTQTNCFDKVNLPEREDEHLHSTCTEVKRVELYTHSPIRLHAK